MLNNELNKKQNSSIVQVPNKLPLYFETQTSELLSLLSELYCNNSEFSNSLIKTLREQINIKSGIYNKRDEIIQSNNEEATKRLMAQLRRDLQNWLNIGKIVGFYYEINEDFHLGYIGQPGGRGSQHIWRLYFSKAVKFQVETLARRQSSSYFFTSNLATGMIEWNGMMFRSKAEWKLALALYNQKISFFSNCSGMLNIDDRMEVSKQKKQLNNNGKLEADFLIIYNGKLFVVEVDGSQHMQSEHAERDYIRDRVLNSHGLTIIRFTASECYDSPNQVANELKFIIENLKA